MEEFAIYIKKFDWTLIATVFGWGITAFIQFRLYRNQVLMPRKIDQINELKNWIKDGQKFMLYIYTYQQHKVDAINYPLDIDPLLIKKEFEKNYFNLINWASNNWYFSSIAQSINWKSKEEIPQLLVSYYLLISKITVITNLKEERDQLAGLYFKLMKAIEKQIRFI